MPPRHLLLALLLAGCAQPFTVRSFGPAPDAPRLPRTYAIEASGPGADAALPAVKAQLDRLGYRAAEEPAMLVALGGFEYPRGSGAFLGGACADAPPREWAVPPISPRAVLLGDRVVGISVRFLDRKTGRTLYETYASRPRRGGSLAVDAEKLAAAALRTDPRRAPPADRGRCETD